MPLADTLFSDLDHEFAATRRMLAAVPWDRADWKPHEKSMPLGKLARHVATLPQFGLGALATDGMNMADGRPPQPEIASTDELLATWDDLSGTLRDQLAATDDERMGGDWTLSMGDRDLFTSPRGEVVRQWTLSHIAHHRGQLSVYLRLLDVPVPGTYGPSADDQGIAGS